MWENWTACEEWMNESVNIVFCGQNNCISIEQHSQSTTSSFGCPNS